MSTTLQEPPRSPTADSGERLRTTMAAVRLSFHWFGTRKSLSPEQKSQAAQSFGAEGRYLSAGKKLLDTRHPVYKAVTAVRGRAVNFWKGVSLPYPEAGVRLIRQDGLNDFDNRMQEYREELDEAVRQLDRHYEELKQAARDRLGSLFHPTDYPATLIGAFGIDYDFPSVEPPDYLRRLNPELYEQEARRVRARFEEAVQLAEEAFLGEFTELIGHLTERLSGTDDGKPKVFRNSAVQNLTQFFERFRQLNVGSHDELDRLVDQAQQVVQGVQPQQLRDNGGLRQQVAEQLGQVQTVLDDLLIERPRRNIVRPQREEEDQ